MRIFDLYKHENPDCCFLIKDGICWPAYEKSAMLFHRPNKTYEIKISGFLNNDGFDGCKMNATNKLPMAEVPEQQYKMIATELKN